MFDAHIQFYAYDNAEGDEFGVGYLGNKEFWVSLVNRWNREDNIDTRYTVETFDELEPKLMRGCILTEVIPDDHGFFVTWVSSNGTEMEANIDSNWKVTMTDASSVPRWVTRLKEQLRNS